MHARVTIKVPQPDGPAALWDGVIPERYNFSAGVAQLAARDGSILVSEAIIAAAFRDKAQGGSVMSVA